MYYQLCFRGLMIVLLLGLVISPSLQKIHAENSPVSTTMYDDFDNWKWLTETQDGSSFITQSGSALHVKIPKPTSKVCSEVRLNSKTKFSGENIMVETKIKPVGKGFVGVHLKKDDKNYVYFGFNTDDVPNVEFRSTSNGKDQQQNIENSRQYFGKNNMLKIVKNGNQYDVYLNGIKKGKSYTNTTIGDSNLTVELRMHTCEWKSGESDNYFDYVKVTKE